jgi:hypothetical protein
VLATFTIALGVDACNSGSNASVIRTWASKFIVIVRRTTS